MLRAAVVSCLLVAGLAACGGEGSSPPDASGPDLDGSGGQCASDDACDDRRFCNGVERCDPSSRAADERGCVAGVAPCPAARCDETADRCASMCERPDADGDGVASEACGGGDCDDDDASRFPGNVERCDAEGHDEDCDPSTLGDRDLDGDGHVDRGCCNRQPDGSLRCGGDCDDTAASVFPGATEVCNGVDDDCDGLVDDVNDGVVICRAGQTVACVTSCGVAGLLRCRGDCLGFESCTADEACNGCDDDLDGVVDEGFDCARRATVPCTTACGTPGAQQCSDECSFTAACAAPSEICNFCDDDGNEGILDERISATANETLPLSCGAADSPPYVATGGARCDIVQPSSNVLDYYAELLDGATTDQAGAFWFDVPMFVGWGPVRVVAELEATNVGGGLPWGGWSVVLATGGSGDVGTPRQLGVPYSRTGVSFDWFWVNYSDISGQPFDGDGARYRRLNGGSASPRGRGLDAWAMDIPNADADLDAGTTGVRRQYVVIEYTPDDPSTATTNEERVSFRGGGSASPFPVYEWQDTGTPADPWTRYPDRDLTVGSPLRLGFTAGTFDGSRVRARVRLRTVAFGSFGAVNITPWSRISRDRVCPGF